jgi:hypothetical protein
MMIEECSVRTAGSAVHRNKQLSPAPLKLGHLDGMRPRRLSPCGHSSARGAALAAIGDYPGSVKSVMYAEWNGADMQS